MAGKSDEEVQSPINAVINELARHSFEKGMSEREAWLLFKGWKIDEFPLNHLHWKFSKRF